MVIVTFYMWGAFCTFSSLKWHVLYLKVYNSILKRGNNSCCQLSCHILFNTIGTYNSYNCVLCHALINMTAHLKSPVTDFVKLIAKTGGDGHEESRNRPSKSHLIHCQSQTWWMQQSSKRDGQT